VKDIPDALCPSIHNPGIHHGSIFRIRYPNRTDPHFVKDVRNKIAAGEVIVRPYRGERTGKNFLDAAPQPTHCPGKRGKDMVRYPTTYVE
jgi:hypothetical protein